MKINNPPVARDLMVTARSFGNYDLATALADLIDNSIKARASSVDIRFVPSADDVVVRIQDNGEGMSKDVLIAAMRPASSNPEAKREPDDLGRFGWGLKSASFSQARVLTVISWRDGQTYAARWDIDDLDDWGMHWFEGDEATPFLDMPLLTNSGTLVIWSRSDRLTETNASATVTESLTNALAHAGARLATVFHRYLAGESGRKLTLAINGTTLQPIDPFMVAHHATQTLDAEDIEMASGVIKVQPYVLPHFSKLSVEEKERLGGPEGMVRNQGFYVYRNRRLIISGTWFRLVPHGELSQLTRVKVDLPNTTDAEWRITLDKSDAQLPAVLKRRLRDVVKRFNKRSVAVHRNKGVNIDRHELSPVWIRNVKSGRIRYLINREHPIISKLIALESSPGETDSAFRLLESYFPVDRFLDDARSGNEALNQCPTSNEEFESLINQCLINYMRDASGIPKVSGFLSFLRMVEPFASQWTYTEDYVRKNAARQWGMIDGL